jgi:hypothetical protein
VRNLILTQLKFIHIITEIGNTKSGTMRLWDETSNPKGPVSYLEPSPILTIICVKFLHTNNNNIP